MPVTIVHETAADMAEYETIPISFEADSRYVVLPETDGTFRLETKQVTAFKKDYDTLEKPSTWPETFDVSNWAFFAAFDGHERVGGAVVAFGTPGLQMLLSRDDIACLWDIRVAPDRRGNGIGKMLFDASVEWARTQGARLLRIETQDINVAACDFYAKQGCELSELNREAYPPEMGEIQMIWTLDL